MRPFVALDWRADRVVGETHGGWWTQPIKLDWLVFSKGTLVCVPDVLRPHPEPPDNRCVRLRVCAFGWRRITAVRRSATLGLSRCAR